MPFRSTYLYVMFAGLLTLGIAVGSGHTSAELPTRPSTVTSGRSRTDVDKRTGSRKLTGSSAFLDNRNWTLPTLANGHLGFTVFEDAVYMGGLYGGAAGLSHRARIPNVANIRPAIGCYQGTTQEHCTETLDMEQGVFRVEFSQHSVPPANRFRLVHTLYPHALYTRLIVNQFFIERLDARNAETISVPLMPSVPFFSEDIAFEPIRTVQFRSSAPANQNHLIYESCGKTVEVEDPIHQPSVSPVCVVWNHVPERLTLPQTERTVTFTFLMSVDGEESSAHNELKTALGLPPDELLRAHTSLWRSFWERFDILTTGNEPLQRAVWASIFYLVSNLPFAPSGHNGLSPTGLGRGGGSNLDDYEGHSFWDTEIWMLPVLNVIDRSYARSLLQYRIARLEVAKELAAELGYGGARYPWESGFTGTEVTQPCCPAVAQYQHHITADISFGLRQHLAATQDLEWLCSSGAHRMAAEIASFWASRVTFNQTGTAQYDIAAVMGPDEDHENVTNNAYTNVVAGYALYFGDFASCLCAESNELQEDHWDAIAKHIKLPYDPDRDYHPQYDGYNQGTTIKQADTVLLGYPLQYAGMRRSTRSNDLRVYESVTRVSGPAMTWAMHSINHLDLGELEQAAINFNRSYQPYIRGPFQVWYELQQPDRGAQNFLTGAGGFLQSLLFGYGGLRLHLDRLELRPGIGGTSLVLPPGSCELIIKGVQYLGALITIEKTVSQSTLTVTHQEQPLTIEFDDSNVPTDIVINETYYLRNRTAIVRSKNRSYRNCRLPEDIIGRCN
ncbi:protein-glucosylgalactosylhydroxylysine glucosidase-like isoform X2 [Anopheles darlingi]|uniref:protein-glucosylgalactosylhydroxylysine glucosidase-like isoform X2 n=1 Tax=Anopheles darlingi TaxID=43151 RepID=UPI0021004981|nr:protein-glucosylgalactosylhydroxylysine glucosidase-like isoform X2 [Anopheles darlingi]